MEGGCALSEGENVLDRGNSVWKGLHGHVLVFNEITSFNDCSLCCSKQTLISNEQDRQERG